MSASRGTRLRPLTERQARRLEALKQLARLFDSAFRMPGTSVRVGLDPILGVVPGLGDLVSPLFAVSALLLARDLGVSKVVQFRMVINVAVDAVLGVVPVVGDVFDVAWKANERNIALLERHAHEAHRPGVGDWLFVILAITLVGAVAAVPIAVTVWLLGWLF